MKDADRSKKAVGRLGRLANMVHWSRRVVGKKVEETLLIDTGTKGQPLVRRWDNTDPVEHRECDWRAQLRYWFGEEEEMDTVMQKTVETKEDVAHA